MHFKCSFETSVYGYEGNDVAAVWGEHPRRARDVIGCCETAGMLSVLAFCFLGAHFETLKYNILHTGRKYVFMVMLQHHHAYSLLILDPDAASLNSVL